MGNSQQQGSQSNPPQLSEEEIRKKREERYLNSLSEQQNQPEQLDIKNNNTPAPKNNVSGPGPMNQGNISGDQSKAKSDSANMLQNLNTAKENSGEYLSQIPDKQSELATATLKSSAGPEFQIVTKQNEPSQINPSPAAKNTNSSLNTTSPSKLPVSVETKTRSKEEIVNDILEKIFEVSVTNKPGVRAYSLHGLENELTGPNNARPLLNIFNTDRVLHFLVSSPLRKFFNRSADKLEALSKFYVNLTLLERNQLQFYFDIKSAMSANLTPKEITSLKEDVVNYATSLIASPEIYDISVNNDFRLEIAEVIYNLILDSNSDFGRDLIINIDKDTEEENLIIVMESVFRRILDQMKAGSFEKCQIVEEALSVFDFIFQLSPRSMKIFLSHSQTFFDKTKHTFGLALQENTIFGAALSVSVWGSKEDQSVISTYFGNLNKTSQATVDKTQHNMRERIDGIIKKVSQIIDRLVRSNPENQKKVLSWFLHLININKERLKINANPYIVCTNGFLLNVGKLLLILCKPFVENIEKIMDKVNKIKLKYLAHPEYRDMTKINSENCLKLELSPDEKDFGFLTEIYFLMIRLTEILLTVYNQYTKFLEMLVKEQSKGDPAHNPDYLRLLAFKFTIDVHVLDPFVIEYMMKYFTFSAILYLEYNKIPFNSEKYQFPDYMPNKAATLEFNTLPSCLLENMADFLSVISTVKISALNKNMDYFVILTQFLMFIFGNKNWLSNTHIRAKALKAISRIAPDESDRDGQKGKNRGVQDQEEAFMMFKKNECLIDNIIPSIFYIFIDVEKTGQSTQFYDKLIYRGDLCEFLSKLLNVQSGKLYGERLEVFIKNNPEEFLNFITKFFSGIIYALDESLQKIKAIKKMEDEEEERQSQNQPLGFEAMNELKKRMEQEKTHVKFFLNYLYKYYRTLTDISSYGHQEFIKDEIRDNVVANLNYTLNQLNGSQFKLLKIKDRNSINFKPKIILEKVIELYVKFEKEPIFLEEIAKSYNEEVFIRTADILEKHRFSEEIVDSFRRMIKQLGMLKDNQQNLDKTIMEGCPDEFIDPLIGDIMRDPVMLPQSKQIVDMMTIRKQLLNEEMDPFTRGKLTLDMVIPLPELKQRIDEYISQKTKKK